MEKIVTIVIPNYNGLKYLEACFRSLADQSFQGFSVLVVDNGSQDGSVEWLKERDIPSLFLPENLGFPGAVNLGIQECRTPYVILLNNDTQVDKDYVGEMVKAIERSPKIFSVSPKVIQMYKPELMDDAGDMYCLLGWAFQRGVGRSSRKYQRPCRIFSACAAAAIYRRSVFEEIGYFDEMHFAYLEDLDVGYRARLVGYDNIYWPSALVYHVGSATSGSKYNAFKVRLAARNNLYLNYKNMPALQLALNAPGIALGMAVKYAFFKKLGFGKEYLEGVKEGFATLKHCKKVPYKPENFSRYLEVEWELFAATLLYIYEFSARQIGKISGKLSS